MEDIHPEANAREQDHKSTVTIFLNGRARHLPKDTLITFEQVVALAFENPPTGDGVQFTIQYTRGPSGHNSGTLLEGQTVKIKEGMEFDVTPTNRS
jgi:Multiubiquitin